MYIGLKQDAAGTAVERLHRILQAAALEVDAGEVRQQLFGPSSEAALRTLQTRHGIRAHGEVDEDTLKILLALERQITINVYESGAPASAPVADEQQGSVSGKLVDEDGAGIAGTAVALYVQGLRSRSELGTVQTGSSGAYRISYRRPTALNLLVQASGADGTVIAQSAVVFSAAAGVEIDLTTAKDGVVRAPSAFTNLAAAVSSQLGAAPLQDLKENKDHHELEFVANAIGAALSDVAQLYIARCLSISSGLKDATLYGVFSQGIPSSLASTLTDLPDTGIDAAFTAQVLSDVLAHSRSALSSALAAALAANVLPASYAAQQDAELSRLDALRVQNVAAAAYLGSGASLNDLLAAGNVDQSARSAFTRAYAASGARLDATWAALQADKNVTPAQLATLDTTLSAGELLAGNLPLVKDTLQRLSQGTLMSVQNLALLDATDWAARIQQVDPQASSIASTSANDTPQQRIAIFSKALADSIAVRYPTTAFLGGLQKAQSSSFKARSELIQVLTAHPDIDLSATVLDQYMATTRLTLSATALSDLKTAQRLQRLSPGYASVEALNAAGYQSAQAIYVRGRAPFVAQMSPLLGGAPVADAVWAQAQSGYASALAAYARFNLALNGTTVALMASPTPPAAALANLPDLQVLFGSLDFCECSDCRSILSPAAYLVDLLQFLKQRAATGGFASAREALLSRRPDLQYIALGCQNTNVTLPYIDVVNELLEAAIVPPTTPVTLIETTGTSDERRALPQSVSQAAYGKTAGAVFPLTLPFDLPFAQTAAFLQGLGTSLAEVMLLCGTGTAATRAGARRELNPALQSVINGSDTHQVWERWGFTSANPTSVVDPKTRQAMLVPGTTTVFVPSDWIDALSHVPVLLGRAQLTFAQLCQLLEVVWVTVGAVTLKLGAAAPSPSSAPVVSCDTELMSLTGLDANGFDRVSRFLRLLDVTGLQMWELDWALTAAGGTLDDTFLVFLDGALALRDQLSLPLQELLAFWGPLPTRDVTSHLGDSDVVVPSTYSSVFRSPTLLASWPGVFVDAGSLSGGTIIVPTTPPPTPAQLANQNAVKAALGLGADDIAAILTATAAANALSLDTLLALFRHARLASSLSLSVPDLLLWIVLTDIKPFGGSPADTTEFLRRMALVQATGIPLHDLDYLLRNASVSQTALAFTSVQMTTLLQTLRDALAKLTAAAQADAPTVATIVVGALSTAIGVSATIVTPVLARTGVLPLAPSVIAQLLAQTSGVDPSLFPQLGAAFTRVAKAAALFNALQPTEVEFAFLVQNASVFNWLDPSALPLTAPTSSPYLLFERLLYALRLNHRQSARSPKLLDVLGGWSVALPADVASAITGNSGALALALNASVADLSTLVTALGATTPVLTSATQAGSLADMVTLVAATTALDALTQYRIGAGTLVQLASAPPTADSAAAAMAVYQARYTPEAWFGAVQPIEDTLRQMRRDALVAYVIGQGTASTVSPPLLSSDDIFEYYLIDPEMCACGMTTRLLEASLAVQQFVQQCFLGLVPTVSVDAATDSGWNEWSWMSQFRLWQANREVFLYPENYLLPELRTDKSPFFVDLENDLKQSNCDADAVTAAFENYLRKLVAVRNLVVAAHYNEIRADGSQVVHVFARTRGTPPQWYYRTRTQRSIGAGIWSAWQALNLDIASEQVVPVVWDQRLHLVWPIFKQISEKAAQQNVPASGGGAPSLPPRKIWTIEFARSELSAGQWQPKSIYDEKLYFDLEVLTAAFTFHAFADSTFNLQLQVYYNVRNIYLPYGPPTLRHYYAVSVNTLVGTGTLSMPDSPILVSEVTPPCPKATLIDQSQEPSFLQITALTEKGSLGCPNGYQYSGQNLVSSGSAEFTLSGLPPAPVPLYVLARAGSPFALLSAGGKQPTVSVELLAQIVSPRIVVPQQEPAFDSADPFFVADLSRTYFVRPYSYIARSRATDTSTSLLGRISEIAPYQWETNYTFETFHHPFARTFLRELEIGGPDQLMQRELQIAPLDVRGQGDYVFAALYLPQPPVTQPYPVEDVDFSVSGANSLYNWELFYHAPMFVASQLMRNQQYQDAMQWLEYVFDPSDPSSTPVPGHFWRTRPFYELNLTSGGVNEWLAQQIESILTTLAADAQEGVSDPDTAAAIADWVANPFDPHRVARLRIAAYAKATVMKFLDNLIAWGDSLYAQYTMEMVAQAEQLYVFADLILGPQPDQVRLPDKDLATSPDATSYAAIEAGLDAFSNELVAIENVIAAPTSSVAPTSVVIPAASLPQLWTLFFCIPPNDQLLAYWSTIADRLYKIRHCLNLQGLAQPLPLYAPPINPLQLIEQAAGGGAGGIGTLAFTPIYRFAVYLERALELTNDVRAYGSLVLAALEKKDAEALGVLKASQDVDIQTRLLDIKTKSATEAQDQITALQNQKAVVQIRYNFYKNIAFMNDWETAAIVLQGTAAIANGLALVSDLLSGTAALIPTVTFGASGFGGSPTVTASIGGQAAAQSSSSFASASRGLASLLSEAGGLSATMGGYNRRQDEWTLQLNLATAELTQLDSQIAAAADRLAVANAEVDLQSRQIDNAQAVSDFLTSKYTSGQLYDWMLSQLTTVHTQAYQMAFSLAQQAQAAYQYELGSQDSFVQFGYWNSQYKGLTAGESLLFDLRRMQAQYLAANTREFELVKHVSLALTQPMALVQLLQTGTCNIALDEALFDLDHPGHYFRRLRSVALTIPCVTGPYAGVNATLALNTATVRVQPPVATYTPASAMAPPATAAFVTSPAAAAASISTSHGQNDAGLFDVNLRDERWLPFEGQGAISTWTLVLDPRDNSFDLSTITDVVLQLRYTARSAGGDPQAVRQGLKKFLAADARQIMLSVRSSFSDAYYAFFNPADTAATQQTLVLPLLPNVLPFSNLGTTEITDIAVYFVFDTAPAASTAMSASFGPTGGSAGPLSIVPVPGSTGGGTSIAAMGADVGLTAPSSPESFSLTVPESSVPAALGVTTNGHLRLEAAKFQDIVLVVSYKVM